jgi:hypothetical protein
MSFDCPNVTHLLKSPGKWKFRHGEGQQGGLPDIGSLAKAHPLEKTDPPDRHSS